MTTCVLCKHWAPNECARWSAIINPAEIESCGRFASAGPAKEKKKKKKFKKEQVLPTTPTLRNTIMERAYGNVKVS